MADEEIPQEEAQEPAPPPPPAVRMVVEDYDANDAQHYAQWVASGRPDLPWQTTWYEDLAEDGETYVRRLQPEQNPVTDVEKYKEVFVGARQNATLLIDSIKAAVQDALVKGNVYSPSEATIQGVEFVFHHSVSIAAYKEAGGHPAAAAKLLSVFKSEPSVNAFRWVPSVAAIFDQALTY